MEEVIRELVLELFIKQPIFWIVIVLGFLSAIFYKKIAGFMGEFWVNKELKKLSKNKYTILNDIMLKTRNGTHQIDHIVISQYGIFVIETKNFYGLILGDEYKDKWTQHLGKNKYYFNNPIHQNYGHIKALEEILQLDEDKFVSIICISNQAKLKVNAKNVIQLDYINDLIKSYNVKILEQDLNEIIIKLKLNNITDKNIRKKHIQTIKTNIKEEQTKEKNMICPKCGGTLIQRNGKYGKFVGCSNYPKCKYTISKN